MRSTILFILLLFIPAVISAMSGNPAIEQEYLFEYSHINFAWGFQMSGMYIDKNGNVYKYDHSHAPWTAPGDKLLTQGDLEEKYSSGKESVTSADKSNLKKMIRLINPASKGKFFLSKKKCSDFGSGTYTAYLFDSKKELYNPVLLYQIGDRPKKNMSAEAKILYEWLFEVFGNKPTMCTP